VAVLGEQTIDKELIMKPCIFLSTLALLSPILVGAQNPSNGSKPNDLHHPQSVITGCLTKNSLNEFELVDQDGFDNLPYSGVVHLNEYVGKTVTLYGRRAAAPSHETGIRGTHFQVSKVHSVSDQCKQ
jgi:hypothetical protein